MRAPEIFTYYICDLPAFYKLFLKAEQVSFDLIKISYDKNECAWLTIRCVSSELFWIGYVFEAVRRF
jgi:hypothetical protein